MQGHTDPFPHKRGMPLNRIAGFYPAGANRIPSLTGVWRWPDQSCPPAPVRVSLQTKAPQPLQEVLPQTQHRSLPSR